MPGAILSWLREAEMDGVDLDSPAALRLHRAMLERKPFLRRIYEEWYEWICAKLPEGAGGVLEIGSGGSFLDDLCARSPRVRARVSGMAD